ncbi:universal stress protein [Dactylosporangium sp. NPDC049140]|uniref:universal stress protein n=1 Tax=Dactylosporangium sp. NPDC049140 TaxID=3155647 RepID=UPI00340EE852
MALGDPARARRRRRVDPTGARARLETRTRHRSCGPLTATKERHRSNRRGHAVDDDTARTIVCTAISAGAGLVVLGPHHRRGLAAWLDGSVSVDVLHLPAKLP